MAEIMFEMIAVVFKNIEALVLDFPSCPGAGGDLGNVLARDPERGDEGPVVGRNALHAKQRVAVGGLAPFVARTLTGEKRLGLHEDQRKRRQADVSHRMAPHALPPVGKGGAGVMQPGQEMVKNQHLDLEREIQAKGNQKFQPRTRHLELLVWRRQTHKIRNCIGAALALNVGCDASRPAGAAFRIGFI